MYNKCHLFKYFENIINMICLFYCRICFGKCWSGFLNFKCIGRRFIGIIGAFKGFK